MKIVDFPVGWGCTYEFAIPPLESTIFAWGRNIFKGIFENIPYFGNKIFDFSNI